MRSVLSFFALCGSFAVAQLSSTNLQSYVDVASLSGSVNPVVETYWTGYPHHRRTPFALSPDGKSAYLAYLDASSGSDVIVQPINPSTFEATGTAVKVAGAKEAGGLVAHDDGFALLTTETMPTGTSGAPAGETPVAVLYRYTGGTQTWKTWLGGPGVDGSDSLATPELNGDLVFSAEAGYYAAYIVVTSYSGSASGHFGDAIRYINTSGKLENIQGASSSWGCSHNTGIAFEAADEPPFASLCAEDQGAIWLNTKTQGMGNNGVKVSNEHVINGGSGEPMGGTGGSYSSMARFQSSNAYIFSWVSRGAIDLTLNDWMGAGYTKSVNRTSNRNVAIALFSDKNTLIGEQATSEVGAADGDKQITWVTSGNQDRSNAHAATFDSKQALVTWEQIDSPICDFDAMGCRGQFSGTYYQLVDSSGSIVGEPLKSTDTFVAGDMVTMSDGRICWPYVNMEWRLDAPALSLPKSTSSKISFACINLGGSGSGGSSSSSAAASPTDAASTSQASSAAAAPTTSQGVESGVNTDVPASSAPAATSAASSAGPLPASSSAASAPVPASSSAASAPASSKTSVAVGSSQAPIQPSSSSQAAVTTPSSTPTKGNCAMKTVWETVTVTGPAPPGY